jgi:hypothetical protein
MAGQHFEILGWHFFANCHWNFTFASHGLRNNPNHGRPIRSIVLLGLELSWWRA